MSHTPGPWEETFEIATKTWGVCLPEGGHVLAQLIESEADVRLIAAAPAMADFIQSFRKAMLDCDQDSDAERADTAMEYVEEGERILKAAGVA